MTTDQAGSYEASSLRPPYNDAVVIPPNVEAAIHRDCTGVMRDLLGSGYVPSYYEQLAGDLELVALAAYRQGVRDERNAQVAR